MKTAAQIVQYIANDMPELSFDKIINQRDDYKRQCKEWLKENGDSLKVNGNTTERLNNIKGCVDRIWSDCFDAPIPFSVSQLDIINSAITQAKLDIERQFNST